jgi:DNA-binding beta-propeller fold protein YncE
MQLPAAATGHMPKMVSMIPGTNRLMTTNWVSGSITVVDCDKMIPVKNVTIGSGAHMYPRGIAIDREIKWAYVNNMGGGTVTVFDLATLSIVKSIPITSNPGHIQLAKDNKSFFVCDNRNKLFSQYSTESGKLMRQVGTEFNALLFSTDKNQDYAVVLHWYNSAATIIDLKSFKAVRQFKIRMPIGISFTKNQCLITTYGGGDGRVSVFEW